MTDSFFGRAATGGRGEGRLAGVASGAASKAWALRSQFGMSASDLEGLVFPGLELGDDPGLVL